MFRCWPARRPQLAERRVQRVQVGIGHELVHHPRHRATRAVQETGRSSGADGSIVTGTPGTPLLSKLAGQGRVHAARQVARFVRVLIFRDSYVISTARCRELPQHRSTLDFAAVLSQIFRDSYVISTARCRELPQHRSTLDFAAVLSQIFRDSYVISTARCRELPQHRSTLDFAAVLSQTYKDSFPGLRSCVVTDLLKTRFQVLFTPV